MRLRTVILSILLLVCAPTFAADEPVTVKHFPRVGKIPEKGYFPHMWFYRTEVTNNTDRPLKVVWFDAYVDVDGKWYASNIVGHAMRSEEFTAWYQQGDKVTNGVIQPGKTAICDVNWHGSNTAKFVKVKWAYILVDDKGNDYYVEKEVDPSIAEHVDYSSGTPVTSEIWPE